MSALRTTVTKLPVQRLGLRHASGGPIKITSALPSRPLKRIRVGKARPAIYYQFDTLVELSDGSVIKRRSQFPKQELRMITDQRNNPLWNQSKPDLSMLDAESRGKLSKFKQRFNSFQHSGKSEEEVAQQEEKEEAERKLRLETGATATKEDASNDDFYSVLDSHYAHKELGGNIAQKVKTKKKK